MATRSSGGQFKLAEDVSRFVKSSDCCRLGMLDVHFDVDGVASAGRASGPPVLEFTTVPAETGGQSPFELAAFGLSGDAILFDVWGPSSSRLVVFVAGHACPPPLTFQSLWRQLCSVFEEPPL